MEAYEKIAKSFEDLRKASKSLEKQNAKLLEALEEMVEKLNNGEWVCYDPEEEPEDDTPENWLEKVETLIKKAKS